MNQQILWSTEVVYTGLQDLLEIVFLLRSSSSKQSRLSTSVVPGTMALWLIGNSNIQGNLRLNSLTANHQGEVSELLTVLSACHLPTAKVCLQAFFLHLTDTLESVQSQGAHILKHGCTAVTVEVTLRWPHCRASSERQTSKRLS